MTTKTVLKTVALGGMILGTVSLGGFIVQRLRRKKNEEDAEGAKLEAEIITENFSGANGRRALRGGVREFASPGHTTGISRINCPPGTFLKSGKCVKMDTKKELSKPFRRKHHSGAMIKGCWCTTPQGVVVPCDGPC